MTAYDVAARMSLRAGISLKVTKILRAMKMANRIMSEKALEFWLEKFKPFLAGLHKNGADDDCGDSDDQSENSSKKEYDDPILFPHEFLLLLAQAQDNMAVLQGTLKDIVEDKLSFKQTKSGLKVVAVKTSGGKYIKDQMKAALNAKTAPALQASNLRNIIIGSFE